jgi:hypothetical protein
VTCTLKSLCLCIVLSLKRGPCFVTYCFCVSQLFTSYLSVCVYPFLLLPIRFRPAQNISFPLFLHVQLSHSCRCRLDLFLCHLSLFALFSSALPIPSHNMYISCSHFDILLGAFLHICLLILLPHVRLLLSDVFFAFIIIVVVVVVTMNISSIYLPSSVLSWHPDTHTRAPTHTQTHTNTRFMAGCRTHV